LASIIDPEDVLLLIVLVADHDREVLLELMNVLSDAAEDLANRWLVRRCRGNSERQKRTAQIDEDLPV
jgi:hypothetical protein